MYNIYSGTGPPGEPEKVSIGSFRRSSCGATRQDFDLCGVWRGVHIHGWRAGILQCARLFQRAEAMPELPGGETQRAARRNVFRPTQGNVSHCLRRVRRRRHGAVQAPGRPSRLLQRLLQQDEVGAAELLTPLRLRAKLRTAAEGGLRGLQFPILSCSLPFGLPKPRPTGGGSLSPLQSASLTSVKAIFVSSHGPESLLSGSIRGQGRRIR